MNEAHKYGPIIDRKFTEFSFPEADALWPDMKNILDKEMPENRKRVFGFWFHSPTPILFILLGVALTCLAIYKYNNNAADTKQKSNTTSTNKLSDQQSAPKLSAPVQNRQKVTSKTQNRKAEKEKNLNTKANVNAGTRPLTESEPEVKELNGSKENSVTAVQLIQKQKTTSKKEMSTDKQSNDLNSGNTHSTNNSPEAYRNSNQSDNSRKANIQSNNTVISNKDNTISTSNALINSGLFGAQQKSDKKQTVESSEKKDTTAKKQFNTTPDKLNPSPAKDSSPIKASKDSQEGKGWVIGASLNYHLPVSNQEMSTVNINGKKNNLIDFLPSLYVQYHFNKKWSIESSFQFSSPQYISNHKLTSQITDINLSKKEENAIWLNKLYYWNVPVLVHFSPLANLTIGTGIQYSSLKRSLFNNETALWEKGTNGWVKTSSVMNVDVCTAASIKKVKNGNSGNGNGNNGGSGNGNGGNGNNGNGNGGNNGNGNGNNSGSGNAATASLDKVDTVAAQTLRSSDWRLLFDINYQWKRFNIGCNFNFGLDNYINTRSGNNLLPVKDRNEALQLYLQYDLFDKRKKK